MTLNAVNNLSRYRNLRGWSLKELGEMIGRDAATVQRAETEHVSAKIITYRLCAAKLDITLEDIFAEDRSTVEMLLLKKVRDMKEPQLVKASRVLDAIEDQTDEASPGERQVPDLSG